VKSHELDLALHTSSATGVLVIITRWCIDVGIDVLTLTKPIKTMAIELQDLARARLRHWQTSFSLPAAPFCAHVRQRLPLVFPLLFLIESSLDYSKTGTMVVGYEKQKQSKSVAEMKTETVLIHQVNKTVSARRCWIWYVTKPKHSSNVSCVSF
jgi:hypothetical protein